MSNPLEDFIISLGFDTSKVKGQVAELHKSLGKLAVNVDAKRVKQALTTEKKISDNKVKEVKKVAKVTKKEQTKTEKDAIARSKRLAKIDSETRRKATIRTARNTVAEYERGTVGASNASQKLERMIKTNASLSQIKALTEDYRGKNSDTRNRMKQEGLLKSFDSASASKGELDILKAGNAIEVLRVRMNKLGIETKDLDKNLAGTKDLAGLKRIAEQTQQQIRLFKEMNAGNKGGGGKPKAVPVTLDAKGRNQLFSEFASGGAFKRMSDQQQAALRTGLAKQQTMTQARSYLNSASQLDRYSGMKQNKVDVTAALESGSSNSLRQASKHLSQMNAEMSRLRRESVGTAAAMSSMHDSTRNMVREYASIYALVSATGAISSAAKAFDGMQAGLVAVTNNAEEASTTLEYLKETILRNGLSMKDAGKDFVKLKAAMGKDKPIQDSIDAFEALARAGVVFQISQDDMSGTIRALSQMFSKSGIQAEEFKTQIGDRLPIAMEALKESTGKTAKELLEMMKQGKLSEEYILPFIKAMQKLAEANGAYEKALKKLGTVENQLKASAGYAAVRIAEAGFTEGLINLYKTLSNEMETNGKTLDRVGKIYEVVFKGLAKLVELVSNVFESFIRSIETAGSVLKWMVDNPMMSLLVTIPLVIKGFTQLGAVMTYVFKAPLTMMLAVIGLMDEFRAFFDEDVDGIFDNADWTPEQRKLEHAKRSQFFGMENQKQAELLNSKGVQSSNPFGDYGGRLGAQTYSNASWLARNSDDPSSPNFLDKILGGIAAMFMTAPVSYKDDALSVRGAYERSQQSTVSIGQMTVVSSDPNKAAENISTRLSMEMAPTK
jgi:tape measure domain-containing protein